jgi:flagellar biosynthesis/type III secretory pathway protein FliH
MSGIIKSRDAAKSPHVRPLSKAGPAFVAEPKIDPQLIAARTELAEARTLITAKDAEIGDLVAALESAFEDGRAQGREAALKEAASQRDVLAAKLQASGERATGALERDLASLERLAVALTLESLEKILGEPGAFATLAPQIIREQLARLDADSVLRIRVSTADFPSPDDLADLTAAIGHPGLEVAADGGLATGDCTIKLALGTLEVGPNQQWARLKEALAPLAEPAAAP